MALRHALGGIGGLLLLGATGCLRYEVPVPPEPADGGLWSFDTDGDGLCDDTEPYLGTDPRLADTDGDGFPDGFEYDQSFDPLSATSPAAEDALVLHDIKGTEGSLLVSVQVDGAGEDFTGFLSDGTVYGAAFGEAAQIGVAASDYFVSAIATTAVPPWQVGVVDGEGAQFRAVTGRTQLVSELKFAVTDQPAADCVRGYAFRYRFKRTGGDASAFEQRFLLIVPTDQPLTEAKWCERTGVCL